MRPLLKDKKKKKIGQAGRAPGGYLHTLEGLPGKAGAGRLAWPLLQLAIAVDPLRESLSAALMEALAQGGDLAEAVQVYRTLRLRRERLRQRRALSGGRRPPPPSACRELPSIPAILSRKSHHNLRRPLLLPTGACRNASPAGGRRAVRLEACLHTARLVTLTRSGRRSARPTRAGSRRGAPAAARWVWLVELAAITKRS